MMKEHQFNDRLPAILDQAARERIENDEQVLRGECIGKHGHIPVPGELVALYATLPVYYPETLWTFRHEEDAKIAIVWLLPIK